MPKLREKYDQLRLQALAAVTKPGPGGARFRPGSGAHVDPDATYSEDPKDVFGT